MALRDRAPTLRVNWYGHGPYQDSPCIHCQLMLRWTGSNSGVTWTPVEDYDENGNRRLGRRLETVALVDGQVTVVPGYDWSTCWSNVVARFTYGGHEPWEAIPITDGHPNDKET